MAFYPFIPFLFLSSAINYDVFLSFRGEDTRSGFTDHLYTALINARIHTFRDNEGIRRGQNIESEIKKAIQESKASIVVFSKDYASSRWCLDELVMIMERRRSDGHIVLPIFYEVDRYEIAEQTGRYGEAFARHEKIFETELETVHQWRAALEDAAELEGMTLNDRSEAEFVKEIVEEIRSQLRRNLSSTFTSSLPLSGKRPLFFFFYPMKASFIIIIDDVPLRHYMSGPTNNSLGFERKLLHRFHDQGPSSFFIWTVRLAVKAMLKTFGE